MKEPTVKIEQITPQIAGVWLDQNANNNRKVRSGRVKGYAADIRAGRWRLSDQAITFDVHGVLVNGQHRLLAIVDADMPITSLVVRNLPTESMLILDGALKRSTDDNFCMTDKGYPRQCGSTVRRVLLGMRAFAGRPYTDQEVDEFMQDHGESVQFVHRIVAKGKFANASIRAPLVRATIRRKPRKRLEKFAEVLQTGMMIPGDESAILLRNFILEDLSLHGGGARSQLYSKTESALEMFLREEPARKLLSTKEELFPLPGEEESSPESSNKPKLHTA
jgi:hypothetical protein